MTNINVADGLNINVSVPLRRSHQDQSNNIQNNTITQKFQTHFMHQYLCDPIDPTKILEIAQILVHKMRPKLLCNGVVIVRPQH